MNDDTTNPQNQNFQNNQNGDYDFSQWQQLPLPKAKADFPEEQNNPGPGMTPLGPLAGFPGASAMPQGGFPPSSAMSGAGFPPPGSAGASGGTPGDPQPVKKSDYVFGKIFQQFDTNVKIPEHSLKFDEQLFLRLLAGSISLTKDEKLKIIKSIPKLSQYQIDELIKILQEEQRKFAELSEKHAEQLEKLEKKHAEEWKDIEVGAMAQEKSRADEAKAEEIRKNLGL